MITYLKGDATNPQINKDETNFIVHICNNVGGWGAGFVVAISKKWKEPENQYRKLNEYNLGDVFFVSVEKDMYVVNMIAQNGIGYSKKCLVNYNKLRECLNKIKKHINSEFINTKVNIHMPRIGCGLGGGKWDTVEKIIISELGDFPIYVYDLP